MLPNFVSVMARGKYDAVLHITETPRIGLGQQVGAVGDTMVNI